MGILEAANIEIYRLRKAKPDNEFLFYNEIHNKSDYYSLSRLRTIIVQEFRIKKLNLYELFRQVYDIDPRVKLKPSNVIDQIIEEEVVLIDDIGFKPIKEKIYKEDDNTYFNIYKEPKLLNKDLFSVESKMDFQELKSKAPAIIKLFSNLHGGDEEAIKDTLMKIADKIHYPEKKAGDCIVFYPAEAAGKGILYKHILQPIFEGYAKKILMSKLKSDFNAFLSNTLLLVLEEGKRDIELVEVLKELITESSLLINEKGKNHRTEEIYFLVFLFSNHMNPADLGKRRGSYHQCKSLGNTLSESQRIGEQLCRDIPRELPYLVNYLHCLEFKHEAALMPYNTLAKIQVNDLNKSPLELFFDFICQFHKLELAFQDLNSKRGVIEEYISIIEDKDDVSWVSKDSFRTAYNNFCHIEGLRNNIIRHNKDIVQLWALLSLSDNDHKRIVITDGLNAGRRIDHVRLDIINKKIKDIYMERSENEI